MTKRTRLVFNFFGAVLLLSISTVVGFAQTSGEMSGLVTDPSGGAPANAAHQGFGVISTTAIPMRQIQLGIKYLF